jgi:hypothetical protein
MANEDFDPFGEKQKSPAMSWLDATPGDVQHIDVREPAKVLQQHDFDTDQPAYWTNDDGTQGKPKMAGVLNGTDIDGNPISLWAPIPGDLQVKLVEAQKALGRQIGGGTTVDRVSVRFDGKVPAKNSKFKKNTFTVKITPQGAKPAAPGTDPWAPDAPALTGAPPVTDEPPF